MQPYDCRAEIFRDRGHEVLGSVVQGTQMAYPDPFDVIHVHPEAREAFRTTLGHVQSGHAGKILLVRGEAGCGKTHLIRALRAQTHGAAEGVVAYVHMTSELGDYRQYLLRQVVRSMSDAYVYDATRPQQSSALDLISDALVESSGLEANAAEKLRDADDDQQLAALVSDYADALSEVTLDDGRIRFADVDLNTLRIFLYRQSSRKPIQRRVGSFLNGESLSEMDWAKLAAMPRDCERGPMHLLGQLARVAFATLGSPLIVCVDQIEASDITGKNHDPFIRAMGTACELIENVPRMMVLLSCLDSAYNVHANHLIAAYRHRIENDPSPVRLSAARSAHDIREIVSRRLKWLYESEGLEHVPPDSVYPLSEDVPEILKGQHLRTVLQEVRRYWEQCHAAEPGMILPWPDEKPRPPDMVDDPNVDRLRIAWNEFHTAGDHAVAEDDEAQIALLTWALGEIPNELAEAATVDVERKHASEGLAATPCLSVLINLARTDPQLRLVGLCDKDPRGSGLFRQLTALESLRDDGRQIMIVLRTTRFPRSGKVAEHMKELERAGHLRAVVEDATWRSMQAMRAFLLGRGREFPAQVIREWRIADGPLLNLPGISTIMQVRRAADGGEPLPAPAGDARFQNYGSTGVPPVDSAKDTGGTPVLRESPVELHRSLPYVPPPIEAGPFVIGKTDGFSEADVTLDPQTLTRHTAIFGANGSGKTVLALTIIELLLERGISLVLFDRKGDLATYAADEAWNTDTGAPDETARRAALKARTDVHLYTPGCPSGRPLVLPLLPSGLGRLSEDDRQEQARQAAMILCEICGPSAGKFDMFATVFARSIELICAADNPQTLDTLQDVLLQAPQELLQLLPAHSAKHCEEVGRRLTERRVAYGRLFSDQGERLNLQAMLRANEDGRVRLNIISTQFLDGDASLIWIAQFLAEAGRFIQRSPSADGRLQALLMFDEADQYIPATRKPVTKAGMDNLLRRARGAGVGIMLASQNAGDFDYKAMDNITTVFAGKLATQRALGKLRDRLEDAVDRLPRKASGRFVMGIESDVRDIKAHMCLIKPTPLPRDQIERLASMRAGRL